MLVTPRTIQPLTVALSCVLLAALAPAHLAAQGAGTFVEEDSNLGRGFDATKAFDSSGIDTVNTFNGNLSLAIPLGLEYPLDGGFSFSLALRYNSSVWDFKTFGEMDVDFLDEEPDDLCGTYSQAWPSWTFNAGIGWQVSLGRLYEGGPPEDEQDRQAVDGVAVNSDQPIVYIGPDGARHEFFQTLHDAEPATIGLLPYYTRDGSYLRLRCAMPDGNGSIESCTQLEVQLPDGGRRVFEKDLREPEGHGWRVLRIEDAFGNHVRVVSYDDPVDPTALADRTWHLEDSLGRSYYIHLVAPEPIPESELGERAFGREVVDRVDVPGVGGQRLVYTFHYEDVRVDRTCRDNYPWGLTRHRPRRYPEIAPGVPDPRESQIWIRRLARIDLPDGTEFALRYHEQGQVVPHCAAGLLERVDLPTGGATAWRYGSYEFPTLQDCPDPREPQEETRICSIELTPGTLSVGVVERTLFDFDGSELGRWSYEPSLDLESDGIDFPVCGDLRVLRTAVTDPLGHRTEHFYSGYVQGDDALALGWKRTEYGLPFTRTERLDTPDGPLFLSTRTLECDDGADCVEKRRSYVRYELDPTAVGACSDGGPTPDYCQATNARVEASRTVYTDSDLPAGEHSVHTERSGFDGLGHYRTVDTKAGNLPGSAGRTTFTNFNPSAGTLVVDHDAGTASPFTPPLRWLLETYTERRVTEGGLTERQQLHFDPVTGFLRRVRVFKNTEGSPPAPNAEDVVTVFTPDAAGNETGRERHGGAFDTVLPSLDLAGLSLGAPEYRVEQTWRHGVLETSHWVDPGDSTETLSIVDNRSIDSSSGLVLSSADPSGLVTDYDYDLLGRLTDVEPTDDLPTRIEYDLTARPVTVRVGRGVRAAADGPAEPEEAYLYDGLGRLTTDRARLPGAGWSERITGYLGDGSVAWMTDRHAKGTGARGCPVAPAGTPARGCTRNLDHDAFGRPTEVIGPDGGRTDRQFFGIRKTVTTRSPLALALGVASGSAERHELRDFDGRLAEVFEPSAGDGTLVKTSYTYDAGGRLTTVQTAGSGQPKRLFFFDGRGFLGSERHPEMETIDEAGLVSVAWDDHDSLGKPGRRTDGDSDLAYEYDFAGRLIRVRDLVNADLPVTEYFYARANHVDDRGALSLSAGKLHQSRRYNLGLSGRPNVVITETFEYAGPEGRPSRSSLRSWQKNGRDVRFTQELAYDSLGNLASIAYPACDGPDWCGPGIARRVVDRSFERGLLRSVRDGVDDALLYASSLLYDANGVVTELQRGNGVADRITVDPSGMPRPREISFTGPSVAWSSGGYAYDGRGDVFAIGNDDYRYDEVGRLLEGEVFGGGKRQILGYDVLGNLTSISTTDRGAYSPSVNPATNRLNGSTIVYSAAGKLVEFRDRELTYDALERPVSLQGQGASLRWAYDADGERVALFDLMEGEETWTLRGPDNQVLRRYRAEVDGVGDPAWRVQDYVRQGTRPLATIDDGQVRHFHLDHLGTPRLVTDSQGRELSRHTYYPFGEEVFPGTGVDHALRRRDETLRFTGHERDLNGESAADPAIDDLDSMHARSYSPFYGRFLTLDPKKRLDASRTPQQWNRYSYALNSPLVFTDPDGRDIYVQVHEVCCGFYHASIRIEPNNQVSVNGDTRFLARNWNTGRRLATLGAGPEGGRLVSNVNRPTDIDNSTKTEEVKLDLKGRNEDAVISALFQADSAYGDDLTYQLFPVQDGGFTEAAGNRNGVGTDAGFNSNSYVSGLLEAVGLDVPVLRSTVPGFDKPVPKVEFMPNQPNP
jgi:RHS repeat-associated protein